MSVIDDYLINVEPAQRKELERVRSIIKEVVPDSKETISYKIPTFKFKDRPLVHFAAFSDHLSLFPTSRPIKLLKDKLVNYKTSKGAIHFTVDNPLPKELIVELLTVRLNDINEL